MVQTAFFSPSSKKVLGAPNSPPHGSAASLAANDRLKPQAAVGSDYLTTENITDLTYLADEANLPSILSDGYPSGAETIELELSSRGREPLDGTPATPKFGSSGFDVEQDSNNTIGRVMGMLRKKSSD